MLSWCEINTLIKLKTDQMRKVAFNENNQE